MPVAFFRRTDNMFVDKFRHVGYVQSNNIEHMTAQMYTGGIPIAYSRGMQQYDKRGPAYTSEAKEDLRLKYKRMKQFKAIPIPDKMLPDEYAVTVFDPDTPGGENPYKLVTTRDKNLIREDIIKHGFTVDQSKVKQKMHSVFGFGTPDWIGDAEGIMEHLSRTYDPIGDPNDIEWINTLHVPLGYQHVENYDAGQSFLGKGTDDLLNTKRDIAKHGLRVKGFLFDNFITDKYTISKLLEQKRAEDDAVAVDSKYLAKEWYGISKNIFNQYEDVQTALANPSEILEEKWHEDNKRIDALEKALYIEKMKLDLDSGKVIVSAEPHPISNEVAIGEINTPRGQEMFLNRVMERAGTVKGAVSMYDRIFQRRSYMSRADYKVLTSFASDPIFNTLFSEFTKRSGNVVGSYQQGIFVDMLNRQGVLLSVKIRDFLANEGYNETKFKLGYELAQYSRIAYDLGWDTIHSIAMTYVPRYDPTTSGLDVFMQPRDGQPMHPFIYNQQMMISGPIAVAESLMKIALQNYGSKFQVDELETARRIDTVEKFWDQIYTTCDIYTQNWEAKVGLGVATGVFTALDAVAMAKSSIIGTEFAWPLVSTTLGLSKTALIAPLFTAAKGIQLGASVANWGLGHLIVLLALAGDQTKRLLKEIRDKIVNTSRYYYTSFRGTPLIDVVSHSIAHTVEETVIREAARQIAELQLKASIFNQNKSKAYELQRRLDNVRSAHWHRQMMLAKKFGLKKEYDVAYEEFKKNAITVPVDDPFVEQLKDEIFKRTPKTDDRRRAEDVLRMNMQIIRNEMTQARNLSDIKFAEQNMVRQAKGQRTLKNPAVIAAEGGPGASAAL